MKIVEINTVDYGSTGNIMLKIAEQAKISGHTVYTFSKKNKRKSLRYENHSYLGGTVSYLINRALATFFGLDGIGSVVSTTKLVKKLKKIKPDIIHLHNLHGWYLNYKILFKYLRESGSRVICTLHDCWSFTGHCPHFTMAKCDKWKTECHHCPQPFVYPQMCLDTSKNMYRNKKEWFLNVANMTLVTPSIWLKNMVTQSFLSACPCYVINNGIDLDVFKPVNSNFREKYGIPANKKIVLSVAFGWGEKKGLDVMIKLAKELPNYYQVVLVGTDDIVDKELPDNIMSIHRTYNQHELAEIYSAADLLVNPTREDTFPTVNIESLACGTPVITFNTGGSPEILDEYCGIVVEKNDFTALKNAIVNVCENSVISRESCRRRALNFDADKKFKEYIDVYEKER